jgi:hypothetical protein
MNTAVRDVAVRGRLVGFSLSLAVGLLALGGATAVGIWGQDYYRLAPAEREARLPAMSRLDGELDGRPVRSQSRCAIQARRGSCGSCLLGVPFFGPPARWTGRGPIQALGNTMRGLPWLYVEIEN